MNTIILFYVQTSLVIGITYTVYYYTYLYMYISIEHRFGVIKLERKLIFGGGGLVNDKLYHIIREFAVQLLMNKIPIHICLVLWCLMPSLAKI